MFFNIKSNTTNMPMMILKLLIFAFIRKAISEKHYVENPIYDDISFVIQFVDQRDKDSKSFVDQYLKRDFNEIANDFEVLLKKNDIDVKEMKKKYIEDGIDPIRVVSDTFKKELKKFVTDNFEIDITSFITGNIYQNQKPSWYYKLDKDLKNIADRVFFLWKVYGKTTLEASKTTRTTKINIDGIFFIPGGRFLELYYWDSYWILIGLLESDMENYAFDIIRCFVQLINKFGYVPNGTRYYYVNRTQPPVFCQMLYRLYKHTNDDKIKRYILDDGLKAAEKEYNFFMTKRRVNNDIYKDKILNMYIVESNIPRYESYKEDFETLRKKKNGSKANIYSNLWTGAESGWDFSSRWFSDGENLENIDIMNIIPVDLNAFMMENERILAKLNQQIVDKTLTINENIKIFENNRRNRWNAMNKVLWNENDGCWNDYNFRINKHNEKRFYFSNIMPLFYCTDFLDDKKVIFKIFEKYKNSLFGHVGGVPCSSEDHAKAKTQQQWDFPNVWPLHVQMFIEYLQKLDEDILAYHVARSFFNSVRAIREGDNVVFMEKYNCDKIGIKGEGGEYNNQEGFGWTNGTTSYILSHFTNRLNEEFSHEKSYRAIKEYLRNYQSTENGEVLENNIINSKEVFVK